VPAYELDPSVRRRDSGRLLVGGMPPRLLRLSEAGAVALDAILAGGSHDPRSTALDACLADQALDPATAPLGALLADRTLHPAAALAQRLERSGLIHPLPDAGAAEPEVTTIVPALDGGETLLALVRVALNEGPVIVVDDGSRDGSPTRAARLGAEVLTNAGRKGPAGARNTGLRAARTDLVAFLDADCAAAPGWRAGLAGLLLADPSLAMTAPRVRSRPAESALAHYEAGNSPLDLGPAPSLVGPGRRVAYLPAAALMARRSALLELGGFDESMRFGEDVDLVWRLLVAGRRARYVPAREVLHAPRPDLRSFARQRFGYGASAPDLAARHGRLAAPLRVGRHTAAVWSAAAVFGPRGALAALAGSTALVASQGSDGPGRRPLAEEALRGQAAAARHLLRAVSREWLPATLVLAARDRRARRLLLIALAIEVASAHHRAHAAAPRRRRAPSAASLPSTAVLRLLDHASYAAGLWSESLRRAEPRALLPRRTGPPSMDGGT
jgi:mycofactocin system glycosyltransferase